MHVYMQIAKKYANALTPHLCFFFLFPHSILFVTALPRHVRSVFFDSRFYHPSNWSSFALKNVGVLAICVATAYSVGYACRVAINAGPFIPNEGDRGLWHAE